MRGKQVYLAGPITGCTYGECTDWRQGIAADLPGIECFSPLRDKAYLKNVGIIDGAYDFDPLATSRGIMTRDFWDCTSCDIVLANLLDITRVSIGTVMEIAWAFQSKIPVVCVMEEGNMHEHPMIGEAIGFRVGSLEAARDIVLSLFDSLSK